MRSVDVVDLDGKAAADGTSAVLAAQNVGA
jgi:hypothetical protein